MRPANEQSIEPAKAEQLVDLLTVFIGDDEFFEANARSVQERGSLEQQAFGRRAASRPRL